MKKFIEKHLPTISLIQMQFKNKTALSWKANKLGVILRILATIVLIIGLTIGLYFLFKLFADQSIFGLFVIPLYFFNAFFIIIYLIIFINCLIKFTNDLYLSPDNQFLVTLPVKIDQIFISKIIVYYFVELFRSSVVLIPIFFAYGLLNNYLIGYYFWVVFIMLFILFVPVILSAVLSIIVLKIKLWLKSNPIKQNTILAIALILIFVGLLIAFNQMPEEIRLSERWQTVYLPQLKNFALILELVFYPILMISKLMLGYTDVSSAPYRLPVFTYQTGYLFVILLAVIAVLFIFNLFITKRFFLKYVAKTNEHKKQFVDVVYQYSLKNIASEYLFVYDAKNNLLTEKKYIALLDKFYERNPEFFVKKEIKYEEIISLLKSEFSDYKFKIIKKLSDKPALAFQLKRKQTKLIVYLKGDNNKFYFYDAYKYSKKSHKKSLAFSFLFKDFIRDFRNTSSLFANLSIILIPSLIVFGLNKIFGAVKLTILGNQLVFAFIILIELLTLFIYSSMASTLFSKDQKNAYILNIAPINYTASIISKLFKQFVIGILSITLLVINFAVTTPLTYVNNFAFLLMFLFLFLFHLLVSAEIDIKSLSKYNFSSKTSEKAGEQNEIFSSVFSIVLAFLFAGISFLLVREASAGIATKLMFIALILFILKLILFLAHLLAKGKKLPEESK